MRHKPKTQPQTAPELVRDLSKEKSEIRLPTSLKPLHYVVRLQPFINGNFSIKGYVEIGMEVLETTNNITLHIYDIITHNETVKGIVYVYMNSRTPQTCSQIRLSKNVNDSSLNILQHQYDHEKQFYIAHLERPLEKGQQYLISMHYTGYLNTILNGFYRSTYRNEKGVEKFLAVTQFQPTSARKAFPCFDEPALKASFEVSLAREKTMSSISNMPIKETTPFPDQPEWEWDHFEVSVPMSTYLLAFVVSDFDHRSSTTGNNNTVFRVWTRKAALDQAEYVRTMGPAILTYFEDYFNVSYPLPKQDMIALPDFSAGAMENWGLITSREALMLYDPKASPASSKQWIASVLAHELAHQWFGSIVTPKWWTDLWLNEGFATYLQYIGVNHVSSALPKWSLIIRNKSNKYKSAEQDDLWHHLTVVAHEDGTLAEDCTVKAIMDTWTLQMGYPVIKVERSYDGTVASVSQEHFLAISKENSTNNQTYLWWVPLNYASAADPDFTNTNPLVWMKSNESAITVSGLPSKDKWVVFNIQQTGFYRVNYDKQNWKLIIQQLKTDHRVISTINRAQIIDDALALTKAGHLDYQTALDIYSYLSNETEYAPWYSATSNSGFIKRMFLRTGGYGALKKYLLDLIVPLYERIGFKDNLNDPLLDQYKRDMALSWACDLGHEDCVNNVKRLFSNWMKNPSDE
ncbi:hypothetical protein SK128_009536 [Halocaridina rubra]|uniref:Aminopeptidase n=1 Tax=Halocaridina rubra TaxID=373956 RepID=A0AAN8X684_HALRR